MKAYYFSEGLGPELSGEQPYLTPFFGWIFLATVLKVLGYFSSLNSSSISLVSTGSLFMMPRILMGVITIVDTLFVYKIAEKRYNPIIAFIASVLFAVMPLTWMTRRFLLEPIQLPFMLASILLATHINSDITKASRIRYISLLSGITLGIAVFTKIPAFTMIPLAAYLVYLNSQRNLKILVLWFIPVICIPLLWPIYALYNNEFSMFLDGVTWQTHRAPQSNPTFFIQQALTILFRIDPVIILLGLTGSVLAAVKRDFIFLFWIVPFIAFVLAIGYVSDFHFLILFPALCIASSVLIYKLAALLKQRMFKVVLTFLVLTIGIYGISNTAFIISSDVAYGYYKAMAGVDKQIQNNNNNNNNNSTVTLEYEDLFSKPIHDKNINYIKGTFMIADHSLSNDSNAAGIVWDEGNKQYYVYLNPSSSTLDLFSDTKQEIIQQSPINYQNGEWYTLKIVYNSKTMNVFLNNDLKIQVPITLRADIWRVGIRSYTDIAKFEPLRIGTTPTHEIQRAYYIPLVSKALDYNTDNYPLLNKPHLSSSTSIATLKGNETLLSNNNPIKEKNVNYIEDTFRVVAWNKTDNHAGIVWINGNNKEYYAFLRSNALSIATSPEGEIASVPIAEARHNGEWSTLKVLYANNTIRVFLNDIPKLATTTIPQVPYNAYFSKVGIRSYNTVAEFKPILISKVSVPSPPQFHAGKTIQYNPLDFAEFQLAQYP